MDFPSFSNGKKSTCNWGDLGSIHGLGRSPGEENGNPLQYCCLDNSMNRGALQATIHGIAESDMTEQLNTNTYPLLKTPHCEFRGKDIVISFPVAVSDWDYTGCACLAGLKGKERCIQYIFQIASE